MTSGDGLILLLPEEADAPIAWLRLAAGRIIAADQDASVLEDLSAEASLLALAPPTDVALHWIDCAGMTDRQADAAARILALEVSLGARDDLHVALANQHEGDTRIVAVVSRSAMAGWQEDLVALGAGAAPIVPSPLVLPAPVAEDAFLTATLGRWQVARGRQIGFLVDDGLGAVLLKDASVNALRPEAIEAGLAAQLVSPALDLQQGAYAIRQSGGFDPQWRRRFGWAIAAGLLLLLAIPLAELVKLRLATGSLDQAVVERVAARLPSVSADNASDAQAALNTELARQGRSASFTAVMAATISAMQASPEVSVTNAGQGADGTVRILFSAPDTQAINRVLIAIQQAGWRIVANNAGTAGGRASADISVVPQ